CCPESLPGYRTSSRRGDGRPNRDRCASCRLLSCVPSRTTPDLLLGGRLLGRCLLRGGLLLRRFLFRRGLLGRCLLLVGLGGCRGLLHRFRLLGLGFLVRLDALGRLRPFGLVLLGNL